MITLFVIKTVDGAELVGETEDKTSVDDPVINVKNPLEIIYHENDYGSMGASFHRYNSFSKNDTIVMWKHAIVSMYPANDILTKAHGDTIASLNKEKMGTVPEERRDSLKETLAGMIEKLSANTTVH